MDPRQLLGVGARAGRAEVRSAQRRLRRAVDPARGGTAELARLVDAAAAQLTGGSAAVLSFDAAAVLGVAVGAPAEEVHAAYRRLTRLVHPDAGGTDELFKVVAEAQERLLAPARRRRRGAGAGPGAGAGAGWRPAPPTPPPPRGPYRAPPVGERHVVPTWRAVRDLAANLGVLAVGAFLVSAGFTIAPAAGAVAVGVVLGLSGRLLWPAIEGALRATIVLLGSRVHVRDDVAPERFLEEACLDAPVGRQRERELYEAYVRWCGRRPPVAPWVFVERLRTLGLLLVKASAWDDGLWVGITLKR